MLQSTGSQKVGHDLASEQQQKLLLLALSISQLWISNVVVNNHRQNPRGLQQQKFSSHWVQVGCGLAPQVLRLREWPLPGTCHSHGRAKEEQKNGVTAPVSPFQEHIHESAHTPLTKSSHMVRCDMTGYEVSSSHQ